MVMLMYWAIALCHVRESAERSFVLELQSHFALGSNKHHVAEFFFLMAVLNQKVCEWSSWWKW